MVQKNDSVWVVRDDITTYIYTCEEYAREEYNKLLKYYESHKQPTGNDLRVYTVWYREDSYACIFHEFAGEIKEFGISISEQKIIK